MKGMDTTLAFCSLKCPLTPIIISHCTELGILATGSNVSVYVKWYDLIPIQRTLKKTGEVVSLSLSCTPNYRNKLCMCLDTQSCLTLLDPMDHSPLGSSVHEILQERIWEWVATPFSKRSSQPRDQSWVSCIAGRFLTV